MPNGVGTRRPASGAATVLDPVSAYIHRSAGGRGPVALMYHVIEPGHETPDWPWAVSIRQFEAHLELFREFGWQTRTLGEISQGRGAVSEERTLVVTFDDGYANNLYAAEALYQRDMRASWFVVSGSVGREPHWEDPGRPAGRMLSAGELRDLAAAGHEIGSHGVNHLRLPEISDPDRSFELTASKAALQDLLGQSVDSFAYPFGAWDERSEAVVIEAGYRSACTTQTGLAWVDAHPYRLRRLTVFNTDTVGMLARKLAFASHDAGWGSVVRYGARRVSARAFGSRRS